MAGAGRRNRDEARMNLTRLRQTHLYYSKYVHVPNTKASEGGGTRVGEIFQREYKSDKIIP